MKNMLGFQRSSENFDCNLLPSGSFVMNLK